MKIENITKTKYQQIAEILDKDGYISDSQLFKIWGDETGMYKSQEHIRRYKKLQADRNFFADKKIIEKKKGYRCHLVHIDGEPKNSYYKVGKQFYDSVLLANKKQ